MPWQTPLFLGSDIYRTSTHAPGHPLAIPRVSLCIDLCRALGWLPDAVYRECSSATPVELARYHAPDYIEAVVCAERDQAVSEEVRRRFNLGVNGHPVHKKMFLRPATACGGSILAARLLTASGVIYNPAGGTHHGRRDRASGFCTFNDPVLAILELLDAGLDRVFYLDVDAHFGDGVQIAFHDDARVFTLSVHEAGRWPMTRDDGRTDAFGGVDDRAGGGARNLPVPREFNDTEWEFLLEAAMLPLIEEFRPQALVLQCGADALADDPMAKLALSNRALWRAVKATAPLAPRLLVLGGGGYNPWAVARCWAGVWTTLNGFSPPDRLPNEAEALLRAVSWNHRLGCNPFAVLVYDPCRPAASGAAAAGGACPCASGDAPLSEPLSTPRPLPSPANDAQRPLNAKKPERFAIGTVTLWKGVFDRPSVKIGGEGEKNRGDRDRCRNIRSHLGYSRIPRHRTTNLQSKGIKRTHN